MKRFVKFIFKSIGFIFLLFVVLVIILDIITPQDEKDKINLESTYVAIKSLTQTAEPTKTPKPTFTITSTPEPTNTVTETPIPTNTIVPVKNTPTSTPKALSEEEELLKRQDSLTRLCVTKFWTITSDAMKYNLITLYKFEEKPHPDTELGTIILQDTTTQKLYVLVCGILNIDNKTLVITLALNDKLIFPN